MKKILITEDNEILLNMMRVFLERDGYQVFICRSGKEAVESIKNGQFDLFLVDIMLPYLNGMEVINQIRKSPQNLNARIIIVSDFTDENYVREGFELGANDFLKKPVSPAELVTRVRHHLNEVFY
ncbi:response regulator transcription factor [Sphingobacterium sp. HJSM2_6]|uniref:response regulator transcription factor n=1 Tax=Sphingobacterium sp. HJSM2_6 TaxID=3366264 RepID=UPI003BBB84B5